MLQKLLFGERAFGLLKGGLDAGAVRTRTISENLANGATPGYREKRVEFERCIREAQKSISLERTHEHHLPTGAAPEHNVPPPKVEVSQTARPRGAVNNVDIEKEVVRLKQNELHYQAISQMLANKYRGILNAIR